MVFADIVLLYLIVIFSFIFFLIILNFKWIIKTLREISDQENQGGYTKLIQIGIIFSLFTMFIFILIYFLFNPEKVDGINIILTVIVGWLGAIIGQFFGEKTMENLGIKRKEKFIEVAIAEEKKFRMAERIENVFEKYDQIINKYNDIIKRLKKAK